MDIYENVDRWQYDIIGRYGHLIHSTGNYPPAYLLHLHQSSERIRDQIVRDIAVGVAAQVTLLAALDTEGFIHAFTSADYDVDPANITLAADKPVIEVFDPPLMPDEALTPEELLGREPRDDG